jgi:hypothetical protein
MYRRLTSLRMLLLFDPGRHLGASTELIARDMGVSIREAEVAVLLANGCDLCGRRSRIAYQRAHGARASEIDLLEDRDLLTGRSGSTRCKRTDRDSAMICRRERCW